MEWIPTSNYNVFLPRNMNTIKIPRVYSAINLTAAFHIYDYFIAAIRMWPTPNETAHHNKKTHTVLW